jgi:hypothetical protein
MSTFCIERLSHASAHRPHGRFGAGFSDVGMTAVRRALADVGEAPRHEVAGDVGRGCAGLYGDLPIAPVLAMIAGGAPVTRLDARSGADRAVFEA